MKEYSLNDIAILKNTTADEILKNLQNVRGYKIAKTPEQPLSPSEIRLIDPILYYNLQRAKRKKEKVDIANLTEQNEQSNIVLQESIDKEITVVNDNNVGSLNSSKGMNLMKASKYFNQPIDVLVQFLRGKGIPIENTPTSRLDDAQYDALKRNYKKNKLPSMQFDDFLLVDDEEVIYIGGVQFYDNYRNHFGYLSTNALFEFKNSTSLRFNQSDIIGRYPSDDNLVFFCRGDRGEAAKVQLINSQCKVNWKYVFRYIQQYSSIQIKRRNGVDTTISDIIGKVISLTNANGLYSSFISVLNTIESKDKLYNFCNVYLSITSIRNNIVNTIYSNSVEYEGSIKVLIDTIINIYIRNQEYENYFRLKDKYTAISLPTEISNSFRYAWFVRYKDASILNDISDIDSCASQLVEVILKNSIEDQYVLINRLKSSIREKILNDHLSNSEVYLIFLKEKWDEVKSNLPYVVFDIESDGENITQFTYKQEDNIREYTSEKQIKSLARALQKQPIVVGHNIRVWDLPILEKKGITTNSFVWDTLEMEILLNPCRYAYSLHTEHNATADTELTDRLFWNQLYRLSADKNLCTELKTLLPAEIESILDTISEPQYEKLLTQEASTDTQFFQELIEPSQILKDKLSGINENIERTLIIAPKNLWPRIAQYVKVAFPKNDDDFNYLAIDKNKVESATELGTMRKNFLLRFIQESKTPIVGNIAQHIRVKEIQNEIIQFNDIILSNYTNVANSNIDCIDIDAFSVSAILHTDYKHIYIVGSELQDRTHKCQLGDVFTFSDLLAMHSKLPFSMASTNFCKVDDIELQKLGLEKPSLTANVWAERTERGLFTIYHNYEYQKYRANFLSHYDIIPINIPWDFEVEQFDKQNIILYSTNKRAQFDSSLYRLNTATTIRSKYWVYQFALIQKIHEKYSNLPIVYVVNSLTEINELTEYAEKLGFYIPQEGTFFRRLEYICEHPKGLIVIDKSQFLGGIGSYRTDRAFCYVWDNMDIERYQLMWQKLPFENDIVDDDSEYTFSTGSTAKQCFLAEWPIFENYYSLIAANCRDSKLCILEPSIEEHSDLSQLVECGLENVILWEDKEPYLAALEISKNYFKDESIREEDITIEEAMIVIKDNFLKSGYDWYDYQKEILPVVLQKQSDCIVSIPTGGGKSVLFQGPAIYRAAFSHKLSLVITPLRALMQDQVEDLQKKGFYTNVDYLSGDRTYPEVQQIYRRIASGEIALLYITPERFRVRSFIDVLIQRMEMDNGLEYVVYDEAHCVSQWGQDFRPDYRNSVTKCVELKEKYPFTMAFFSATVTTQVENDLRNHVNNLVRLGLPTEEYNPIHNHIGINFNKCHNEDASRISAIAQYIIAQDIDFSKSRMLVFCRTHKQCEEVADELENIFKTSENKLLSSCSEHVTYFHAGLDSEQRNDVYEQFKSNKKDRYFILCATKAFGMGMDIPNVHYVIHFSPPSVLEDYLQEVGRAGRDIAMYNAAFPTKKPIPALCLTSIEDFAKLKDLLIKSLLKWSDLKEARSAAIKFIKRFQSLETTRNKPIVIPYNFWQKSDSTSSIDDTTSAKLALHWLDYIGYFKQGYIGQACIDVTLLKTELNSTNTYFTRYRPVLQMSKRASNMFEYLKENIEYKNQPTLISIVDLRRKLHYTLPAIFDAVIECQKHGLITLNDQMQCETKARRYLETIYMLNKNTNVFALHIIMEGLRDVLKECKVGQETILSIAQVNDICKHLVDNVSFETKIVTKKRKNKEETTIYMPWHDHIKTIPKGTVTKAETFKKNITTRAGLRMFSIMNYIPGVRCQVKKIGDELFHVIELKTMEWQNYSVQLENDCWEWLKFVQNKNGIFAWADAIISLNWDVSHKKGYKYFINILSILRMISYIDHTSPVQNGIELYTTETTTANWDAGHDLESPYYKKREEFDAQESLKKIRLAAMNVFAILPHDQQSEYIRKYFLCRNYDEFLELVGEYVPEKSNILEQLKEEALKKEEARLENNVEQKSIYLAEKSEHINVLAGPGSGKTHVLTLRCARMIYRESVDPSQIMVLAYNRAVVAELKTRLDNLFIRLGMSRVARRIHVYTFSALAKKTMGPLLDNCPTSEWEKKFYDFLIHNPQHFRRLYPNLKFIMIDEFQDMTQVRLNAIMEIHNIYPNAKLFTIGDINQSIYGFDRVPEHFRGTAQEYAHLLDPRPYYKQLNEKISPLEKKMFTNYRSYQDILDAASVFLPPGDEMPKSDQSLMKHEPEKPYVVITDTTNSSNTWIKDLPSIIEKAKKENSTNDPNRKIQNIAVFFRTNAEVYRGFSKIKNSTIVAAEDIRIRIQGASSCEMWREREVYEIVRYIQNNSSRIIVLRNNETQNELCSYIEELHNKYPKWDTEYLDIAYSIILNYLDSIRADEEEHTWAELATYCMEVAGKDDGGQVHKIFDQYQAHHLWPDERLTIILTTMHKVKGLEFDMVIITPSFANLPLKFHRDISTNKSPQVDDLADMKEEKRLLFVAYTRAKKFLYVYKWHRELAIENQKLFEMPTITSLRYTEKEAGIDKYFLSYTAQNGKFDKDIYIKEFVKKDDPIDIVGVQRSYNGMIYYSYEIRHNGRTIGQLSRKSSIYQLGNRENISLFKGFFISDVFIWSYQETLDSDMKNSTSFADKWCEAAKKQGYITVVQIAGFGEI